MNDYKDTIITPDSRKSLKKQSISFVLPMFNECEGIAATIEAIGTMALELSDDFEIVVADDASTDGSVEIVERLCREKKFLHLVCLRENTKFGGALAAGLKRTQKDIVIYTDSDLPVALMDIKKALLMIDAADIITAVSRQRKSENLKRKVLSWGYNFLLQVLFRMNMEDVNSGFKIFRRAVIKDMDFISCSPFIDAEIFIKAGKRGAKIATYPIVFRPRCQGSSKIARFSVVFQTFIDMCKYRLNSDEK